MSPVLLWTGSSLISPIRDPVGVKSTSHRFSAWREKRAKFMPPGVMVAPSCMGEPGETSKDHLGESVIFFMRSRGLPCIGLEPGSGCQCIDNLLLLQEKFAAAGSAKRLLSRPALVNL